MHWFFARKSSTRIFFKPRSSRWPYAVLAVAALTAAWFFTADQPATISVAPPGPAGLPACPAKADGRCDPRDLFARTEEDPCEEVLVGTVKPGDTLAGILDDYIDAGTLATLENPEGFSFSKIQSGQPYRMALRDRELVAFEYDISPTETLVIDEAKGEISARVETHQCEVRQTVLAGTVSSSLFAAIEKAGGDTELAVSLADIFSCDIDFCQDVRLGDTFRAVVEKRYVEGRFVGLGRVLAASFTNRGKTLTGFGLPGPKGRLLYYDANGRALRKAFLRAPLSFLRITSRFSGSRLHPILKVRRPHYGVDYAAPTGTPVWSVGAGVVVERGRNAAAGNYVTVRHSRTWVTRYNHFSRFAKGLHKGSTVAQGQVIGYVGSTGYATGPHLDFRIYKNGVPVNALANPQMTAEALPAARKADLKRQIARLGGFLRQQPGRDLADKDATGSNRLQ